jgi:hypothetical protein
MAYSPIVVIARYVVFWLACLREQFAHDGLLRQIRHLEILWCIVRQHSRLQQL